MPEKNKILENYASRYCQMSLMASNQTKKTSMNSKEMIVKLNKLQNITTKN